MEKSIIYCPLDLMLNIRILSTWYVEQSLNTTGWETPVCTLPLNVRHGFVYFLIPQTLTF